MFEEFLAPLWRGLDEQSLAWTQYFIEILIFCVFKAQGFRIRQFLIQNKVFQTLLRILPLRKKPLNLAIIKLFKAILLSSDEVLLKYVHSNNYVVELAQTLLLERRGSFSQISLVFSCCLELFDLIYRKNLKKFIKSICENESFVSQIQRNPILRNFFSKIFSRFEQYKEEDPFSQIKQANNKTLENPNNAENEIESKEKKNLEELAYFENDANEQTQEKEVGRQETIYNKEELKERKEHLLDLQNKFKRKLESPQEEGLVMKRVHTGNENGAKKIAFGGKIDIVFQDKESHD